jgi:hypothetical protein
MLWLHSLVRKSQLNLLYQSVLQELMLFFQNNLQLNHYDILNNTDDNFLDNLYTVEESAFE